MKKLDDKILKDDNIEERVVNDGTYHAITCDCCNLPSSSLAEAEGKEEEFEQPQDLHEDDYKKKFFDSPKLLIVIGLALTIPIVLLEMTHHNIMIDYVTLALATPVQFILGRPFYIRFYKAV